MECVSHFKGAWARTAGVDPAVTCKRDWACPGSTGRDFILGCPLASAALGGCWVDCSRWIQPHFTVFATFQACRWSARVTQPVRVNPLWPASWVSAVDKSRNSKSVEVRENWEIYDHRFQLVPVVDALAFGDALVGGDLHLARDCWSAAAERALASAFGMAGGPVPTQGLVLGRGRARVGFLPLEARALVDRGWTWLIR